MGKMFVISILQSLKRGSRKVIYLPFLIKFVIEFLTFLKVKKYEMYLTTIQLCSSVNSAML